MEPQDGPLEPQDGPLEGPFGAVGDCPCVPVAERKSASASERAELVHLALPGSNWARIAREIGAEFGWNWTQFGPPTAFRAEEALQHGCVRNYPAWE